MLLNKHVSISAHPSHSPGLRGKLIDFFYPLKKTQLHSYKGIRKQVTFKSIFYVTVKVDNDFIVQIPYFNLFLMRVLQKHPLRFLNQELFVRMVHILLLQNLPVPSNTVFAIYETNPSFFFSAVFNNLTVVRRLLTAAKV